MIPEEFIGRWKNNKPTERAGIQAHFDGLCDLRGVGNDPRYTPTATFKTAPFPPRLTPHYPANFQENADGTARAQTTSQGAR